MAARWYFTRQQLIDTPSRKSGIDGEKELSYRQQAANLIQDMGQRLAVTQLCINTAIVYMHRFYMFHSFTKFHRHPMSTACLFLAAKVEEQPRKLEHVLKTCHGCLHREEPPLDVTSNAYLELAQELVINENILLQTLGFEITIDHPHTYVVRTCQLVRASKDLAQTSYFLATNSLHLTTMCLEHSPKIVCCVCILLACKWANWEIPKSSEGRDWVWYVDSSVTMDDVEKLTQEFLDILDKCPSKLKKKLMASRTREEEGEKSEGTPSELGDSTGLSSIDKVRQHQETTTISDSVVSVHLDLTDASKHIEHVQHNRLPEPKATTELTASAESILRRVQTVPVISERLHASHRNIQPHSLIAPVAAPSQNVHDIKHSSHNAAVVTSSRSIIAGGDSSSSKSSSKPVVPMPSVKLPADKTLENLASNSLKRSALDNAIQSSTNMHSASNEYHVVAGHSSATKISHQPPFTNNSQHNSSHGELPEKVRIVDNTDDRNKAHHRSEHHHHATSDSHHRVDASVPKDGHVVNNVYASSKSDKKHDERKIDRKPEDQRRQQSGRERKDSSHSRSDDSRERKENHSRSDDSRERKDNHMRSDDSRGRKDSHSRNDDHSRRVQQSSSLSQRTHEVHESKHSSHHSRNQSSSSSESESKSITKDGSRIYSQNKETIESSSVENIAKKRQEILDSLEEGEVSEELEQLEHISTKREHNSKSCKDKSFDRSDRSKSDRKLDPNVSLSAKHKTSHSLEGTNGSSNDHTVPSNIEIAADRIVVADVALDLEVAEVNSQIKPISEQIISVKTPLALAIEKEEAMRGSPKVKMSLSDYRDRLKVVPLAEVDLIKRQNDASTDSLATLKTQELPTLSALFESDVKKQNLPIVGESQKQSFPPLTVKVRLAKKQSMSISETEDGENVGTKGLENYLPEEQGLANEISLSTSVAVGSDSTTMPNITDVANDLIESPRKLVLKVKKDNVSGHYSSTSESHSSKHHHGHHHSSHQSGHHSHRHHGAKDSKSDKESKKRSRSPSTDSMMADVAIMAPNKVAKSVEEPRRKSSSEHHKHNFVHTSKRHPNGNEGNTEDDLSRQLVQQQLQAVEAMIAITQQKMSESSKNSPISQ